MTQRLTLPALTLFAILLPAAALAQTNRYTGTSGDVSLSATAMTLTLQKASTPQKTVILESITVYCSVACNMTQAYNGGAATATAGTATPVPANVSAPAFATVWTASNVGGGTAVGPIVHVPAGSTITIDVSKIAIAGGVAPNYSATIAAITGTANLTFIWSEN